MSEEWGPWIEHDGRPDPVPAGTVCGIEIRSGLRGVIVVEAHAGDGRGDCFDWASLPPKWQVAAIIRYRIRKPRGLTILEEVANGVREPVDA